MKLFAFLALAAKNLGLITEHVLD